MTVTEHTRKINRKDMKTSLLHMKLHIFPFLHIKPLTKRGLLQNERLRLATLECHHENMPI